MSAYTILLFCTAIVNCFGTKNVFDKKPYYMFDSKTAYQFVRGHDMKVPENCEIQQIFTLLRHGTRGYSEGDNKEMLALFELKSQIQETDYLDADDINVIKAWTNENSNHDKGLTDQGVKDMRDFAQSMRNAFGDIFNETFNPSRHKVLSSKETRAKQSGLYFLQKAFDDEDIKEIDVYDENDVTLNVDLMRKDRVDKSEKPKQGPKPFQNGSEMNATLKNIAKRLGIEEITFVQAKAMYESCRHETADDPQCDHTPAWCRVFSEHDIQVFEFFNDLNWHNKFGYGSKTGSRLGCPLLTRLNLSFKLAANGDGARCVVYMGHRANQFTAITMLDLFKDKKPLTATNMADMAGRQWRTSRINPFASNFVAAFYKCDDGVDKVSFFVNEHIMPIKLDGKSTCTVCPWKKVVKKFDKITGNKECTYGRVITPP